MNCNFFENAGQVVTLNLNMKFIVNLELQKFPHFKILFSGLIINRNVITVEHKIGPNDFH